MFLDKYWPTKTEISSCIKRDAETVSEALLMAVHRKMSFDVEKANKLHLKDEQELLNAFLDASDGGPLVLPVMGASGVGKSHVIRWLHANLKQSESKDSLHIIRIPKTASLKQVVEYILEPLSDDENYASIRSDLDTAVDVGNQQASIIRFMAELENVLEEHAVKLQAEQEKTTDKDEKKILRTLIGFTRQIPFLMTDPSVKEHFVKTALNRITKRAHSGSQDQDDVDQYDNQQQFKVDDFRLPRSVDITRAASAVQTFYNNIDGPGNDSVRQQIVDFLNADQLIDKAIRNTYNLNKTLGGKSIPDLILQIRKKLLGDGKELVLLIEDNVNLLKEIDKTIEINFNPKKNTILLNSDNEQLSRVFFNLIKNSIESIQEKKQNNNKFKGIIDIDININIGYVDFVIIDNGVGFEVFAENIKNILNPYFTTKKKGTGLGLAIVNKIINDHNGSIIFTSLDKRAKINIKFIKNDY